jgi:DNA polymerase-3 subunit gamma/tau
MATVLYRKYRPQTFREISNQNHVKIILQQEVAQDKFAHAYLFSGPRGTGKTSTARILAKALNCLNRKPGEGEPCNQCSACQEITSGSSMDVLEIDAASHTGVDTVREVIIETARFAPSRLRFKVFIIDEAQMLSTSAWNALLKILEEPPKHVIFIFATTEVHKIPVTILSRCQRFDFKRLSPNDIIERLKYISSLEKKIVAPRVFQAIARLSEGSVRDAESLLEQVFALGEQEITEEIASIVLPQSSLPAVLDFLKLLFNKDIQGSIELLNRYLLDGFDLAQFTTDIIETLRKMMLLKLKSAVQSSFVFNLDETLEKDLSQLTSQVNIQYLLFLLKLFLEKQQSLKFSPIPQLPLEMAVVEAVSEAEAGQKERIIVFRKENEEKSSSSSSLKDALPRNDSKFKNSVKNNKNENKNFNNQEEKLEEMVEEESGFQSTLTLETIQSAWLEVLNEVLKENNSLPLILRLSQPLEIKNNVLKIGVGYAFHKDKLNEQKNRLLLEKILEKYFHTKLKIEAVILERQRKEEDDLLQQALDTFGGVIIE